MNDIDLLAKARARQAGHALELDTAGRYALTVRPLALAMFAFSGEDATVSTVMIGRHGENAPRLAAAIANPRNRDEQYAFFKRIGDVLMRYFEECAEEGTFPQVVVPGSSTVNHVHALTHRVLGLRSKPKETDDEKQLATIRVNAEVREGFGQTVGYWSERSLIAGQQILIPATEMLTAIWATGQSTIEDAQIHAVRAWVETSAVPLDKRLAVAEDFSAGARTMPEFDNGTLTKLLGRHQKARKANDAAAASLHAQKIQAALLEHLAPQYEAVRWAIHFVQLRARTNPALQQLANEERRRFEYFHDKILSRGIPLSFRNQPQERTRRYLTAESTVGIVEHLFARYDAVEAARLEATGKLHRVQVTASTPKGVLAVGTFPAGGPSRGDRLIDVVSEDVYRVQSLTQSDEETELTLSGSPRRIGTELVLIANGEDFAAATRIGGTVKKRIGKGHWIHDQTRKAPTPVRPRDRAARKAHLA